MTMLYSSQGTIRFPIAVGQTLIVQNISGVETVSGSSASREDASARFGSGYFVYGPQSSAGTIQLSTTGQLDYQLVVGDATPWNNFIPLSGSSSGVSAGGDLAAGSAAVAAAMAAATPAISGGAYLTTIPFGDSITDNQFGASSTATQQKPDQILPLAWFPLANAMAGSPWTVIRNAGVGFNRSSQMLARVQTDVIQYKPRACEVMGGTNDIYLDNATAASVISNLQGIYEALKAAGIYVRAYTILPRGSGTTAKAKAIMDVNAWIIDYWSNDPRGEAIDLYSVWVNYSDSVASPISNYSNDSIHPNTTGAFVLAQTIAPRLASAGGRFKPVNKLASTVLDDFAVLGSSAQYAKNPMCTGTGGTLQSGNTGTVPDNVTAWTGSGAATGVHSVVAAVDGVGQAHQVVYSSTAAGNGNGQINLSTVPAGVYVLETQVVLKAGATQFNGYGLILQRSVSGNVYLFYPAAGDPALTISNDIVLTMRSLPFVIAAGDSLTLSWAASFRASGGSATIQRSKTALRPAVALA